MICLYNTTETDFTHNGVCVLDPSVCTVSEQAGGSYELYLEHPFDKHGKYMMLAEDMIIKAPIPYTVIPAITLPERTICTVTSEADFYQKPPVYKYGPKTTTMVDRVRADPTYYAWKPGVGYNGGSYCVYNSNIYMANGYIYNQAPGTGTGWRFVATLSGTSGSGTASRTYTPGTKYNPGLDIGATVTLLASFDVGMVQIRDQLGRVGYINSAALTESTIAAETIPEQTIGTQLFRIYSLESEEETEILHVYARHISYDLSGNKLMDCNVVESNPLDAIALIQGNMMIPDSRRIACQFEDESITRDWSFKNPIAALLDPDEGLVPILKAKLIRNNRDYYILKNENNDKGFRIDYGINMKGVNWRRNVETRISRVVPRCKTGENEHLYLEHGGTWNSQGEWVQNDDIYVESSIASSFAVPKIEVMDCKYSVGEKYTPAGSDTEVERTEASCREEMLNDAKKRFTEDHCDGMEISLTVEFLLLGDTEQYKQYRNLQRVNLYDEITVNTKAYAITAQVTAYEFDCLMRRYNSIDVGNVSEYNSRVPGYRVVNESITYQKLSPELISMIRTMGASEGGTTGSGGSVPGSGGGVPVGPGVVDALTSYSTTDALSANQGRVLKGMAALSGDMFLVEGGTSVTKDLEAAVNILVGIYGDRLFVYVLQNAGTYTPEIATDTYITISHNGDKVTISNSGSNMTFRCHIIAL